jgi:large conductance mechanosensitive channel
MPVISLFLGGIDFANLFIVLKGDGTEYATLALAQEAGASTLNYGLLISTIINFIIIGFVIFMMVKGINRLNEKKKSKEPEEAPTTKDCPYCKSSISIEATRCPNCTSELK